jgi:hypothetical protein
MEVAESRNKSEVRRRDKREITGKRENKMNINRYEKEKAVLCFRSSRWGLRVDDPAGSVTSRSIAPGRRETVRPTSSSRMASPATTARWVKKIL